MALGDYIDSLSEPGSFDGFWEAQSGKAGWQSMMDLEGTDAYAAFLRDQLESGYLSDASVNPAIRSYLESTYGREMERQQDVSNYLQASGVDPSMAASIVGEQPIKAQQEASAMMANLEDSLQQRRYQAGESATQFAAAESAEEKSRAFQIRTFKEMMKRADQQRDFNNVLGVAGLALGGIPAIAGMFNTDDTQTTGQNPIGGQGGQGSGGPSLGILGLGAGSAAGAMGMGGGGGGMPGQAQGLGMPGQMPQQGAYQNYGMPGQNQGYMGPEMYGGQGFGQQGPPFPVGPFGGWGMDQSQFGYNDFMRMFGMMNMPR